MKILFAPVRYLFAVALAAVCLSSFTPLRAAELDPAIPAVIRKGFTFFSNLRPEQGINAWREGGLAGEEVRTISHGTYFIEAERSLGKYVSYEHITTKTIGAKSKIIYVAINYERGAVYSRFHTYRTDKDWVVQSMHFNVRPEALMPWLAFESEE